MGDRLASIIEDYRRIETEYFLCIYDNSNSQSLFQEELAKLVRRENATEVSVALLGGLCDLSHLRQSRDEESLVAELVRDAHGRDELISLGAAELTRRWQEGSPFPGEHAIRAYIERHGHINPRNLELMFPRWREDPSPAFESLLRRLSGESPSSDHSEVEAAQTQAYDRARDELRAKFDRGIGRLAPWRKRSFLDGLETTRSLLWWREELRMYSTKIHAQVRRFALELGRRLEAGGVIERAEDIFFLEWPDAVALGRGGLEGAEARSRIACASLYYESFKEFDNPDEIGARFGASRSAVADRSSEGLEGIGCSAGTYRGPARVVPSVAEIGRIRSGDVLVTHCTDPGWTTAFSMLGAVVTETGGVLSHAAVIAREYGFPAVLAVAGATRRIRDGALIEVDGSTGRVRLEPGG